MKNLFTLTALLVLLISCQKEISEENGGGGTVTGTKLLHVGVKEGSDSSTIAYTYNSADRITVIKYSGSDNGQPYEITIDFVRNAANTITQQIIKGDFGIPGLTQIVTNYTYDAGTSQYKSGVTKIDLGLMMFKDSTIYTYSGSRLSVLTSYQDDGSGTYVQTAKQEYTYSGNNAVTVKAYSFDNGQWLLEETVTYEYDAKTNPLQFTSDAPVLGVIPYFSANNVIKASASDGTTTDVMTTTYTYNTSNRPATSTTDGVVSTYHY